MKKTSVGLLIILAILSGIIAIIYFTHTAGNLPHSFLGYAKGSSHKHVKHGLAFSLLAIVLLLGAWMASGPKADNKASLNSGTTD